jgi:NADH-quinone oxidoreductase subunit N
MGSFASGILLFGICLIYGATGTFNLQEIHELSLSARIPDWFYIGLGMIATGMLFKIAAAPFHFWAPDVYEGAPAITTATMSTLSKVVAAATFYKLTTSLTTDITATMSNILVLAAGGSMIVGNFMALKQENVKRMLAFSGISHTGYMVMILLATQPAAGLLLYYTAAYALAGLGAFAVILFVTQNQSDESISHFNGLSKTNPLMAALLTSALLSMAGIPVFAGFFAKLMVFNAAIENGYLILVLIAVINSIVSMGYYFKIILAMYTKQPDLLPSKVPFAYQAVAVITIVLNLLMGLFPSFILDLLS